MPIEVHVDNAALVGKVRWGSVRVEMNLDQRWIASFTTNERQPVGKSVGIFDDAGQRIFGGSIDECEEEPIQESLDGFAWYRNSCVSWEARTDRRVVEVAVYGGYFVADALNNVLIAEAHGMANNQPFRVMNTGGGTLPGGLAAATTYYVINRTTDSFQAAATLGGSAIDITSTGSANLFLWRAREIIAHLATLGGETLTLGTVDNGGFHNLVFDHVTVSEAIAQVAQLNGWVWHFAPDGTLNAHARTAEAAPFDLDDSDSPQKPLLGTIHFRRTRQDFQNTQFRRIAYEAFSAEEDLFSGGGGELNFWLSERPIRIDSVTVGGAELTHGVDGAEDGKEFYWRPGSLMVRFTTAPPTGTDNITIAYRKIGSNIQAAYNSVSIAERASAEGNSGTYASIVEDSGNRDAVLADALAQADVARYGAVNGELSYETIIDGLRPGQIQTVTFAAFGLSSAEMLINSVVAECRTGSMFRYAVRATTAARLSNFVDLMATERTASAASVVSSVSSGETENTDLAYL